MGFEPTCRDEPTTRFRVELVMTASIRLQSTTLLYVRPKRLGKEKFPGARINASISDGGKPVVRYFVDGRFFCAIMYYIYM